MVRIITDSSSLYTIEEGRKIGIESVPLCVSIGDCHERDLQMDMTEFYKKIAEGQIPTSSQPPIGEVVDAYEACAGDKVINISMAQMVFQERIRVPAVPGRWQRIKRILRYLTAEPYAAPTDIW